MSELLFLLSWRHGITCCSLYEQFCRVNEGNLLKAILLIEMKYIYLAQILGIAYCLNMVLGHGQRTRWR